MSGEVQQCTTSMPRNEPRRDRVSSFGTFLAARLAELFRKFYSNFFFVFSSFSLRKESEYCWTMMGLCGKVWGVSVEKYKPHCCFKGQEHPPVNMTEIEGIFSPHRPNTPVIHLCRSVSWGTAACWLKVLQMQSWSSTAQQWVHTVGCLAAAPPEMRLWHMPNV